MTNSITHITRPDQIGFEAVKIHAADYNPQSGAFDGSPVSHVPQWLKDALISRVVTIGNPGCTDYASFGVEDNFGNKRWASPGDYLIRLRSGRILVVDGAFFDMVGVQVTTGESTSGQAPKTLPGELGN